MRAVYIAILLSASLAPGAVSPDAVQQAEQEFFTARYERAAELYAKLLYDDPAWAPGYYGAVRALIGVYRAHEAYSVAEEGLRHAPETADVQAAAGLAAYRSGDLPNAEACFRKALKINPKSAAGLSGLASIYNSISKFKPARTLIIAAYHALPGDPRLITAWANTLRGDEHIVALERALAIYGPVPISPGTGRPYGVGLRAQLNKGHTVQLMLDTGSSGISISPKAAEKAGLEDGDSVALQSLRGSVVVLDFWVTWCGPCRAEFPAIEKLRSEFAGAVRFYGVSDESPATVKKFVGEHRYEMPMLLDSNREIHRRYGIRAIPALFVIDRESVVRRQFVGSLSESELRKAIRSVVEQKSR